MKLSLRYLISPLLLSAVVWAGCAGEPADPEYDAEGARSEIEAVNARFESYVSQQQWDSLMTLYTDDAILMPPGAPMAEGRAIRDGFAEMGESGVSRMDLETVDVAGAGDMAYEVGRYTIEGPSGMHIDEGKYLVVWMNVDGEWRLHRDAFNSDLPSPAGMPTDTTAIDTLTAPGIPRNAVPQDGPPSEDLPTDTSNAV